MGKAKKTRKFAEVKRMLNPKDVKPPKEKQKDKKDQVRQVEKVSSALFFKYNTQLGPPYQVLVDTNFINFSIKNKVSSATYCNLQIAWLCCHCCCCNAVFTAAICDPDLHVATAPRYGTGRCR